MKRIATLLLLPFIAAAGPMAAESDPVRGKTMQWSWTKGPTADTTHEHTFNTDGTMTWRILDGKAAGKTGSEKEYLSARVSSDVQLVSYLAHSGFTITLALNFKDGKMVGSASNGTDWFPVEGTFQVVK